MPRGWPLLALALTLGCDAEDRPAVPPPPTAGPSASDNAVPQATGSAPPARWTVPDVIAPNRQSPPSDRARKLQARAAFELAPTGDGALLAWADGEAIVAESLDAQGRRRQRVTVAERRDVERLGAGASAERSAILWARNDQLELAMGGPRLDFEAPRALGPTVLGATHARGQLTVTPTKDGRLVAFARGVDEPCEDQPSCASFGVLDLPPDPLRRSRPGLAVPHPCRTAVAAFAVTPEHWHYGVCRRDGPKQVTTLFTARPDPSYAQAHEILAGCIPTGATAIGEDLFITGWCGTTRNAVRITGIDLHAGRLTLRDDELRCVDGAPELDLDGERFTVTKGTTGLASLLPPRLATPDARAVWTGERLLVAEPADGTLTLRRWACRKGRLAAAE